MSGLPVGVYVFYEAADSSKQLYYGRFDGQAWTLNMKVPETMTESAPSPVAYNGKLYCFYQYGGAVWYNVFDGGAWRGYQQVPDTGASWAPSAVVYQGLLYVFHQGTDNCGQLWCNVMFPDETWTGDVQIPGTTLLNSPSAVVCTAGTEIPLLYCFHQGYAGAAGTLWYNSQGPDGWWSGDEQVPNTGMTGSPSAVQYGNCLLVLHAGSTDPQQLWRNSFSEQGVWSGDSMVAAQALKNSPGACVFGNRVFCFFNVWGSDANLCCATRVGLEWADDWALSSAWLTGSPGCIAV